MSMPTLVITRAINSSWHGKPMTNVLPCLPQPCHASTSQKSKQCEIWGNHNPQNHGRNTWWWDSCMLSWSLLNPIRGGIVNLRKDVWVTVGELLNCFDCFLQARSGKHPSLQSGLLSVGFPQNGHYKQNRDVLMHTTAPSDSSLMTTTTPFPLHSQSMRLGYVSGDWTVVYCHREAHF